MPRKKEVGQRIRNVANADCCGPPQAMVAGCGGEGGMEGARGAMDAEGPISHY